MIQGLKYNKLCAHCGKKISRKAMKHFNVDGMNYGCSDKCYSQILGDD